MKLRLPQLVEKFMQIRAPLFVKIMAPLVVLIILTVGLSGYLIYQETTRRWQADMDTRVQRVAALVANTVDIDQLQLIREPADIDGPAYAQIAGQLEQATTAGNLAWVGIYYREGDYFYYWADYDYSGVGYPFFYATPAHLATYLDQQPRPVEYTDEFGSYFGYIAPIIALTETGESQVVGLVEALIDQESRYLLQRATLNRVLLILVVGSIIAISLSALITVSLFNLPLRQLQKGALILARGQFGHTISLPSRDELSDLADTFNYMSGQLDQFYRQQTERERVQHELEIARRVQQGIFPARIPQVPGLAIAALCRPHRETSGDFYDLLALGDGQLGVVVGDVSGKSISAAMLMVAAQSTIRAEAYNYDSPARVLDEANAMLYHNILPGMFTAASYARLDVQRREMVWANAGQIYPFLLRRSQPVKREEQLCYLETHGDSLPLGMTPAIRYYANQLSLLPGDTVVFYTDGIVEAMNPSRQLYGFERLEVLMRSLAHDLSPQALVEAIMDDVAAFVGPADQHDDITIVAVTLTDGLR